MQGKNEKSIFHLAGQKLVVRCYVDDGCICRLKAEVLWFLEKLAEQFNCKDPVFFSEKVPIDHLGMSYFMHEGRNSNFFYSVVLWSSNGGLAVAQQVQVLANCCEGPSHHP